MESPATTGAAAAAVRPRRADARRNRESILRAAREVFAEDGREAQMDDVARRAEVGIGTVYRHFPTKEQLYEALAAEQFGRLAEIAQEALAEPDPWAAFAELLMRAGEQLAADRVLSEVIGTAPRALASVEAARAKLRTAAAEVMIRAQAAGAVRPDATPEDLPMLMCGVGHAMHSGVAQPDAWRRHIRILLDGLRPDAAAEPLP